MKSSFELKKAAILLFLIPIVFSCNTETDEPTPDPVTDPYEGPSVSIPDSNFEASLIARGIDTDGEINQRILLEDALAVTQLELFTSDNDSKITDLTGIEAFANLKWLSVSNNALTTISLGENKALERLNLDYNQLKNIDLSANTALTVLSIGRNALETIDLSANINLEYLNIEANNLETLDISHNTGLTELNAIVNRLTSVTGLDKTTKLKTLNLAWNDLTELNVNLASLEGMNVEQNYLENLNIDGCVSLEYLLATVNQLETLNTDTNQALRHLKVSYNQLNELSLSNNPDIEIIWASGNQLSNLDVSELTKLYDLRIIRNQELTCIKISPEQDIPTVHKENHQNLNTGGCD